MHIHELHGFPYFQFSKIYENPRNFGFTDPPFIESKKFLDSQICIFRTRIRGKSIVLRIQIESMDSRGTRFCESTWNPIRICWIRESCESFWIRVRIFSLRILESETYGYFWLVRVDLAETLVSRTFISKLGGETWKAHGSSGAQLKVPSPPRARWC